MRRLAGQAAGHFARAVHRLAQVTVAAFILLLIAAVVLAWRLSLGPVPVPFLAGQLERAVNSDIEAGGGQARLHIADAKIAWEGWSLGVDSPLDVRLEGVRFTGAGDVSVAFVRRAGVSLSFAELLLGRLRPRVIGLDGVRVDVQRGPDGTISLDLGREPAEAGQAAPRPDSSASVFAFLTELAQPPQGDHATARESRMAQLREIRVRNAAFTVDDQRLGATWHFPEAAFELKRGFLGGVTVNASGDLGLAGQTASVMVSGDLLPGSQTIQLHGKLGAVQLAALARAVPRLAPLAVLDAPLSLNADLTLGPGFVPVAARIEASAGKGSAVMPETGGVAPGVSVSLSSAALTLSLTSDTIHLEKLHLALVPHPGAVPTVIDATGEGSKVNGNWQGTINAALDRVLMADLPALWPKGVGGPGARPWITENIPSGLAHDARFQIGLQMREDFSAVAATSATGSMQADDLEVHWLRPIPPAAHVRAELHVVDADTIDIALLGGTQMPSAGAAAGIAIHGGNVRITGLTAPHQIAAIDADAAGALADMVALLKEKRLHLFDRRPLDLQNPAGQASVQLTAKVPLENAVRAEDVGIKAHAHLDAVKIGHVIGSADLSQGVLDVTADTSGLKVDGRANLAEVPAQLSVEMDFRAGPASQVIEKLSLAATAEARQLAAFGLDAARFLGGRFSAKIAASKTRGGRADVQVQADLQAASLTVPYLGWGKPAGPAATLNLAAHFDRDRLSGLDGIVFEGDGLSVQAKTAVANGHLTSIDISRFVLGQSDVTAKIGLGPEGNGPYTLNAAGRVLDVSQRLTERPAKSAREPEAAETQEPHRGPAWSADIHFGSVLLADGKRFTDVTFSGASDGDIVNRAQLHGRSADGQILLGSVMPAPGGRAVRLRIPDAGEALRAAGVFSDLQGGVLALDGSFADTQPGHPLSGSLQMTDFRVRNAPIIGRILQAMTLYGLVDVLSGPGLAFSDLKGDFRYANGAVAVADARAFSPSLGLTAKGSVGLRSGIANVNGTVVPAYFFNTMLGRVPVLGQLFSPEAGGGLVAVSYTVRGTLDDPEVAVNPLSALTPGALRGIFHMF
jgi:hypothetical protein